MRQIVSSCGCVHSMNNGLVDKANAIEMVSLNQSHLHTLEGCV
jgi:hypothetical protein